MKRKNIQKIFLLMILLPALWFAACGQQGAVFSILPTGQSYQGKTQSNKIDILWVIDNSGSMLTKQQNLANSFNSFMSLFTQKNYDFHMAIVTTDTNNSGAGGQDGNFQGVPTVIQNTTANFANVFQTNVVVGATGSANAKALDAINLSLSAAKLAGNNAGFLRSDAHLVVIVLSDADDNDSTTTVANTISFLQSVKPAQVDPSTGRSKQMFTTHVVIDDRSNPGPVACVGSEDGIKFRQIAQQTNGSIMDICANNFSTGLASLSEEIAQFISQILLKQTPQVSTIVVTVNGVTISQSSTNGWTYDSSDNKIVFHGTAIPADNASISITYTPADIIR